MDGFKKSVNTSIQARLSFALSMAILAVALIAGTFSFVSAFDEAHELQDETLRQVAVLLNQSRLPLVPPVDDGRLRDQDDDARVTVQYLSGGGWAQAKGAAGVSLPLPVTLADGRHTLELGGEPYRVLVRTTESGDRIAVAQQTGVRDGIARDSALRTVMPLLILMPILLLLVSHLVRRMFRPIAALSMEIDRRTERALHPVQEARLPVEVQPFAVAINRLLSRVAQAMDAQRRFVADAAHELRSPLTAISLQAERLAESNMPDHARERLAALQGGIARGRVQLDQLLTLAKAQTSPVLPNSAVSVQAIFRRVLEDLMPLAEARRIDIGVEGEVDAQIMVSEFDMIAVVRNLVDNAIRYSPPGGRVDLSVALSEHMAVLRIQDTGPGIAPAERERVFDPFYRTLGTDQVGSGLGLSIVKTICERIDAEIVLDYADQVTASGLAVCVRVPLTGQLV
jgi:two-component system OmpR family sensor kinase